MLTMIIMIFVGVIIAMIIVASLYYWLIVRCCVLTPLAWAHHSIVIDIITIIIAIITVIFVSIITILSVGWKRTSGWSFSNHNSCVLFTAAASSQIQFEVVFHSVINHCHYHQDQSYCELWKCVTKTSPLKWRWCRWWLFPCSNWFFNRLNEYSISSLRFKKRDLIPAQKRICRNLPRM